MKTRILFALTIAIASSTFARDVPYGSGTVRYPSGAPAPGVRVEYYPGHHVIAGRYTAAITDANGRYEIIGPEDTAIYTGIISLTNSLMARAVEGNLAAVQDVHMTTTEVDLVLQPAINLSGSVKDTEGAPIVGAEVDLGLETSSSFHLLGGQPTKVNELGQFSVPAEPQGREYYIWRITAKGYGSANAWAKTNDTQTNRYEFPTFVLKRADRKIAGRVMDEASKPLAGAEVFFTGPGQPVNYMGLGKNPNSTTTDSEGRFYFNGVCDTPLKLHASYRDPLNRNVWLNVNNVSVQAGDTNIVVRLPAQVK